MNPAGTFPSLEADIDCAIRTEAPVLLSGGSAAARLALARYLHSAGLQRHEEFTVVPRGRWDAAAGTLFVPELGALSDPELMAIADWVDRQIVAGRWMAKLITATERPWSDLRALGGIGESLWYRLNIVHVVLPAISA